MSHRRPSAGFTLIEVLVAVALTGLVALLAHRLLTVTTGATRALEAARRQHQAQALGQRWLRLAFGSLATGGPAGAFDGRPGQVEFSAWVPVVEGWTELQRFTLAARQDTLTARVAGAPPIVLADSVEGVAFDYLLEPGADTRWSTTWQSPVSAPLAVRLRVTRRRADRLVVDTMLYLIRERG